MSTVIDERIVEMRFDNAQFKQAAGESLNILEKLSQCIDKSGTADNVGKIAKSIDGINFGNAVNGVESLAQRFSMLGIVGKRVIENITDGIMGKFSSAVHNMTSSIISGGINRAMNIENARFQLQGIIDDTKAMEAGFKDAGEMVESVMQQAGDSVDGTAYSYDVAAKAASMFAASGVKAGTQMEQSLKAIAGVSATFNANYEDISNIFTTVAGQGKVMADQLNQLSFRGMNAAASIADFFNQVKKDPSIASEEVAKAVQQFSKGTETTEAEIRDLVSKGKINFGIFSEAMAVTFGDHAKDANKTFNGAMANIRAALARTGEMFVAPLIKENGSFVRLFNSIRKKINEFNGELKPLAKEVTTFINRTVKHLSRVIDTIHVSTLTHSLVMGLQGVGNILRGLMTYLRPIKEAFTETFGGVTYKNIIDAARAFKEFTSGFKASTETAEKIKTAFKGIFDVVKLGIDLFTRLISAIFKTSEAGNSIGGSFLDIASSFGETLSNVSKLISESKLLDTIFEKIGAAAQKVGDIFSAITTSASGFFNGIKDSMSGLQNPLSGISDFFEGIKTDGLGKGLKDFFGEFKLFKSDKDSNGIFNKEDHIIASSIADAITRISSALAEAIKSGLTLENIFKAINEGLIAGIAIQIMRLIESFKKLDEAFAGKIRAGQVQQSPLQQILNSFLGPLQSTKKVIDEFSKSIPRLTTGLVRDLNSIATNIDAKSIKEVAKSILILSVGLKILSTVDAEGLKRGLGAVTAMLVELTGAILALTNLTGRSNGVKNALAGFIDSMKLKQVANILLKMGVAVLLLSVAVKSLSSLSWEELAKGLGAVTVLLFELVAVTNLISPKQLTSTGTGLILVVAALRLMVGAVKELGSMNVETLAQGLIAIGIALFELAIFTRMADEGGLGKGLGMVVIAKGLLMVGQVLTNIGQLSWEQIKKGLLAMGVSLLLMVETINNLPDKKGIRKAFIVLEMAFAMIMIAKALEPLTTLNPEGLTAAVIAMGAMLYAITKSVNEMPDEKGIRKAFAAIEMALALMMIASALEPLASVNSEGLLLATFALGAIMYAMADAIGRVPDEKGIRKAFAAIEMAAALVMVSKALEPLTKVNQDGLVTATFALGAIMYAMVTAIDKVPDEKGIRKAFAVIEMAGALVLVSMALQPLAAANPEGLLTAMIALGVLLGVMTIALESISDSSAKALLGGVAAIEMAASMWIIAQALAPLASVKPEGLLAATVALGALLVVMSAALIAVSDTAPIAIAAGAAAVLMAASMWIIAQALVPLANAKPENLLVAVTTMGALLVVMTGCLIGLSYAAPLAIAGGAAALLLAISLGMIANTLIALTSVPIAKILDSAKGLGLAITILGGVAALIGVLAPLITIAFMQLVVAAGAISLSIAILIPSLNSLSAIIDNIATAVKKFETMDLTKFGDQIPILAELLVTLGLALKSFGLFSGIGANSLNTIADAVQKLAPALSTLASVPGATLKEVMGALATGFAEFGLSLKTFGFFSGIGAEALNSVATSVMILAPALTMLSNVPAQALSDVMSALAAGFAVFGNSLKEFGFFSGVGAEALATLAEGIAIMAPALHILSEVPGEQLAQTMGAIGGGFRVFGESLNGMDYMFANGKASALNTLCEGVESLAKALPAICELDTNAVSSALSAIGSAFKDFGTAIQNTPVLFANGRAESIGTLCDQISKLADGIMYFIGTVGYSSAFKEHLTAIGDAFKAFGTAISNTPILFSNDRAASIGTLCDQITKLSDGMKYFMENTNVEGFDEAATSVGKAFQQFGTALLNTPLFGSTDKAVGIATLVNNIEEMVDGINYFIQNADSEGFDAALTGVKDAFVAFGTALKSTPWFAAESRANSMSTMIDNVKALADNIKYFQDNTGEGALDALDSIKESMVGFSTALKDTPWWNAEGRSNSMVNIIKSMNDLADAVAKIAAIEGDPAEAMGVLAGGAQVLGTAFSSYWSGISDDTIATFNSAVTAIQTVAGIDSAALTAVNDALRNMLSWMNTLVSIDTEQMAAFSESLTTFATEGISAFTAAFSSSGEIANCVTKFVQQVCAQLKNKSSMFMTPGDAAGRAYLEAIKVTATAQGPIAAIDIVNAVVNAIKALEQQFTQAGIDSAMAYIKAIEAQKDKAKAAGETLGNSVLEALKNLADEFKTAGVNCALGFANGLADNAALKAVADNAAALGAQAVQATKQATEQASPSKKFIQLGRMCGIGFAIGLDKMGDAVSEASANLGTSSVTSLNDAIKSIYSLVNDYMDFDPTIRPDVDMSNIRRATDETTRLFNQAIGKSALNAEIASASIISQRPTRTAEEIQNGITGTGNTYYSFVQNNNSPKPLSRLEIYRDTRSLLKQVEGI